MAGKIEVLKPSPLSILKRLWAQGQDDSQGEKKSWSRAEFWDITSHPVSLTCGKKKKKDSF